MTAPVRGLVSVSKLTDADYRPSTAAPIAPAEKEKSARDLAARQVTYDAARFEFTCTLICRTKSAIRNASRRVSLLEPSLCPTVDRMERIQRTPAGEFVPAPALIEVAIDQK